MNVIISISAADIEAALKKALLERAPYSHEEAPLLLAARSVIKDHAKAISDLIAAQVQQIVSDAAVAAALRERLLLALGTAIEEKAGSIVRSLTKADIAKLMAPTLEGVEP